MATKGINRAANNKYLYEHLSKSSERCIFLSHASKDKEAVKEIGSYIMKAGVDIYLDENDSDLQAAISRDNNDDAVTKCIERGLSNSTDILCIVSEGTKNSWWVPYEVGYGKKSNAHISTLLLEDVNTIPSYLKITNLLKDIEDLNKYLDTIEKSEIVNESFQYKHASSASKLKPGYSHPLIKYVKSHRAN